MHNLSKYFTAKEAADAESIVLETLKRNPAGATHAQLAYDLGRLDIHLLRLGMLLEEMQRIGSIKLVENSMAVSDQAYGLVNASLRIDVKGVRSSYKRRAAAALANRLEWIASHPLDSDEIKDALHRDKDFTDAEVVKIAGFMSELLNEAVELLDEVNNTDRPLLTIKPHDLAGFEIE